ncbi:hypothetical protein [Stappia sp. MMSF_3263]|uniref:hypothetical protein n=1 Tax=Stappia sp. MMSF_3263 TaxID=3046693 RepID=UPI00273ED15E|nr:hypothetical protein [Stappia sp. MMSF_3263]
MTEAARTEIELEEGAFLPEPLAPGEAREVPFTENSRLMVIGIEADAGSPLVWKAQVAPNGPWSEKWVTVTPDAYSAPLASGTTADGRVAIVAIKSGQPTIDYIDEAGDGSGPEQSWNAPVSLGLPPGVTQLHQLRLIADAEGRVSVFALTTSGDLWWIRQNPDRIVEQTIKVVPPGASEPITITVPVEQPPEQVWGTWQQLSGQSIALIEVAANVDGRILIAGVGSNPNDRHLYVNQQTVAQTLTPQQWTGWTQLDTAASGPADSLPCPVLDKEGALNIFMIGNNSDVVQIRQSPPGSLTWSQWIRPGMVGVTLVNLAADFDADGHIMLVAQDENHGLHANQQVDALFQQWRGWQKIGISPGFGYAVMDYSADGRLFYFQQTATNGVACLPEAGPESTSWEAGWTVLATSGFQSGYTVVRDLTPPQETPD